MAASVALTYVTKLTVVETLGVNVPGAEEVNARVIHDKFNANLTLKGDSSIPVSKVAVCQKALAAGAATLDLTARQPLVRLLGGLRRRRVDVRREGAGLGRQAPPPAQALHAGGPKENRMTDHVIKVKSASRRGPASEAAVAAPSPVAAPADQRGFVCRHCGCKHFRVIYTRPAWGGRIVRRRECRHCEQCMTTWERGG
jgi:hypothetical protein